MLGQRALLPSSRKDSLGHSELRGICGNSVFGQGEFDRIRKGWEKSQGLE